MAATDEAKAEWVRRVLGVEIGGTAEGRGARYSPVALGKAALGWRRLCAESSGELAKLKQAIITAYSGDEWDEDETAVVVSRVDQLDTVLSGLDTDLADTVDDFLNAADGLAKDKARQTVLNEISDYEQLVSANELLAEVDSNEFLSTGLRSRAMTALGVLREGFVSVA